MAYSFTVDIRQVGTGEFSVRITETDCSPANEAVVDVSAAPLGPGCPIVGNVRRQTCVHQLGTATTINPVLREVPVVDPESSTRVIVENDPNNQPIPDIVDTEGTAVYDDATPSPLGPWGRLYHQSRPDAGADNTIVSIYRISARW